MVDEEKARGCLCMEPMARHCPVHGWREWQTNEFIFHQRVRIAELESDIAELVTLLRQGIEPPPMPISINTKGKINNDLTEKMRRWRELEQEAVDKWCNEWCANVRTLLSRIASD